MTVIIRPGYRCFRLRLQPLCRTLALLAVLCALHPSKALTDEHFWADGTTGLAIGGFDPVSFFTEGKPRTGSLEHEYVWKGVAWQFANQANRAAFTRDPEIYAPQFGGLDSVALARGFHTAGNPRIWLVSDGRLYLFFSKDNRLQWSAMMATLRPRAVAAWKKFAR